jgi:stalled ribosome rescue protein Dom34
MSTPQPKADRGKPENTPQQNLPEDLIARLMEFQPQQAPVISLYLDARTNEHGNRTYGPFVRKRLTELAHTFAVHSPERESFDEDFVRIERYLEEEPRPSAQGLAIFTCSAANDFFDVGQFEVPFERNRVHVSDRPQLYPVACLVNKYPRYAVLTADTNSAHIFVFSSGLTIGKQDIQSDDLKEPRWSGYPQYRLQNHVADFQSRHAKEVMAVLERTVRDEQIDKIILAGDQETIIPLLREQMSKELAEKVIDVVALNVDAPAQQILKETQSVIQHHNSLNHTEKVQRLMNEYRADDLAVVGVPQTLAALSNGQVEELLITARPTEIAYDEAEVANVLRLYQTDDRPLPAIEPRSIADELVRRAQEYSAARVTFIEEASDLQHVGGVGALLRYRISADHATPYEESSAVAKTEALVEA